MLAAKTCFIFSMQILSYRVQISACILIHNNWTFVYLCALLLVSWKQSTICYRSITLPLSMWNRTTKHYILTLWLWVFCGFGYDKFPYFFVTIDQKAFFFYFCFQFSCVCGFMVCAIDLNCYNMILVSVTFFLLCIYECSTCWFILLLLFLFLALISDNDARFLFQLLFTWLDETSVLPPASIV